MDLPTGTFHINGLTPYVDFCVCLLSQSIMFSRSTGTVASIHPLFLFMAVYYSTAWFCPILCICSSVGGHLCWSTFAVFSLVLPWTFLYRFLLEHLFRLLRGSYLDGEWPGHVEILVHLLRKRPIVFHSSDSILPPQQPGRLRVKIIKWNQNEEPAIYEVRQVVDSGTGVITWWGVSMST